MMCNSASKEGYWEVGRQNAPNCLQPKLNSIWKIGKWKALGQIQRGAKLPVQLQMLWICWPFLKEKSLKNLA
jgi:hypothetical protein